MDLQDFIAEITGETADDETVTVHRGHPDRFASEGSALEMLVRMQHYSLLTRLLDATWNPQPTHRRQTTDGAPPAW